MIVLQLHQDEALAVAEMLSHAVEEGHAPLIAWDPIDRAVKVKYGIWSPPLGKVIADD